MSINIADKDVKNASSCKTERSPLIIANDNLLVLRFYQKRGLRLKAVYSNAREESRRVKPEISHTGLDGIPLRDEIELEMPMQYET